MCNCSFSCNMAPFMVVPFGREKRPTVPFDDIAPHIITLGGCFIVATVYRTSKRVPTGLRTCCLRMSNCWIVDSSEKRTFTHCFSLQSADLFANITLLAFIASVSLGFSTGLWDLRPNSFTKRLPIVVRWTSVPFKISADRIFLQELVGERTATLRIKWSSRGVVFRVVHFSFYPHTSHRFWISQLLDAQLFCYTPPFHWSNVLIVLLCAKLQSEHVLPHWERLFLPIFRAQKSK